MHDESEIAIELVYAKPEEQSVVALRVPAGTTAAEAVTRSRLKERFPEVERLPLGIFGKRVERDTPLSDGDRIEIYRPLTADPKQARRSRVKKREQ